jgi:imidazolonepropionase-like amidohydrolase
MPLSFRAAIVALLLIAAASSAQVTAIKAGRMIDAESGTVLTDQVILVRDGLIEAVGPKLSIPKDAKVIDLSGMTVMPGLLEMHSHLIAPWVTDPEPLHELERTSAQEAYVSIPNAKTVLLEGFTTVRDVGTYRALVDVAMRDAIAQGIFPGPRMFVAGAYITITGGAGAMTGMAPDIGLPWDLKYGEANSPWEARQKVRMLAGQNVNVIKVLVTGAILTHNSNHLAREFTLEELTAIVDEANNFGLKVAAHGHNVNGIKNAVRAGVSSIEHGTFLDDEVVAMMKAKGTFLVPTLEVHSCIQANANLPKDFLMHDSIADIHMASFRRAVKAGVKIAYGTDNAVCGFRYPGREFEMMVKGGMTPMQALQAATVAAADLLGQSKMLGSIKAGKYADIVAVKGDPIADISIMQHVNFVMKAGVVYKSE